MRKGMTCLFLLLLTSSLLVASDKRTPAGGMGKEAGVPDPSNPFRWVGRLGEARFSHDGQITGVVRLPNWKKGGSSAWNQTLSSAWDESLQLWDPNTGKELPRVEGVGDVGDTNAGRWDSKTGGGIDRIYLLDGGTRVLTRVNYSGYGWELWDRKSRKVISADLIKRVYGRIMDVDERTGKLVGIASRIPKASDSRVFIVQIDQPIEKRIFMGSTGGIIPDWIRFTQNPDQFVSARCYAKMIWRMWDVNTPEKRIDLPTPSYIVRRRAPSFGFPGPGPAPTRENVYARQMRLSQNRKQIAMPFLQSHSRSLPQKRQIFFWSFPEMEKLGSLDIDRLSGGKNNASWATDVVFSRWSDSRMWVWRNAPKSPNNLWWKGAKKNRHQNEGAIVTPTRLELRDKPAYTGKAMGKDALAKWVGRLGAHEYKAREKASTVLESIHDDDIPVLATFNPRDPEAKTRLLAIRKTFKIRKVDYRLRAAIDLPVTVELLAEHPDGRHVLIYGEGKFATGKGGEESTWGRGFVWLRFDPKKSSSQNPPAGVLQIVRKFQLPLLARSMRFARDGELLIGTAAGTVELFSSIQPR